MDGVAPFDPLFSVIMVSSFLNPYTTVKPPISCTNSSRNILVTQFDGHPVSRFEILLTKYNNVYSNSCKASRFSKLLILFRTLAMYIAAKFNIF